MQVAMCFDTPETIKKIVMKQPKHWCAAGPRPGYAVPWQDDWTGLDEEPDRMVESLELNKGIMDKDVISLFQRFH